MVELRGEVEQLVHSFGAVPAETRSVVLFAAGCCLLAMFLGSRAARRFQRWLQMRTAANIIRYDHLSGNHRGRPFSIPRLPKLHPILLLVAAVLITNVFFRLSDDGRFFANGRSPGDRVVISRLPQIDGSSTSGRNRTEGVAGISKHLVGSVTHVRDGDTIEVAGTPIRFANLDCAELGTRAGERVKRQMAELVKGERLECRLTGRRSYDRMIGECALPTGQNLSSLMIKGGYCGRWR